MRFRLLLLAAVALAVAAGLWVATRPEPPADEALVLSLLEDGARAAEARKPSEAVAGISEDFRGGGLGKRELRQLVAVNGLRGSWVAVKLAGVRVAVDGDAASARFGLVLSRGGPGTAVADLLPDRAGAWRVEARLRREPEGWRVVGATWREASLAEALADDPPGDAAR